MAHSSIENVQEAESKAKSIVDSAEKHKSEKIAKAQERASGIIAEAEDRAKKMKEEMLEKAKEEIGRGREKGISDAKELVKSIGKTRISKERIRKIGSKAAKEIIG